jgi:hypothetical protein
VVVHELAKCGFTKAKCAKVLGVTIVTFYKWLRLRPTLLKCYKEGRKNSKSHETFRGYAYRRLSPKLRKIWDKINVAESTGAGTARIEQILEDAGKKARQHLFIYAWVTSNFNPTEACRILCMDRQTFEGWYKSDPDFHVLFDEMNQVKKDFFEAPLISKVEDGDIKALLFVNSTYNADRGYGRTMKVDVSGSIDHKVNVVPIRDLNLELNLRKALYQAIKERNEAVMKLEHQNGNGHNGKEK